MDAEAKNRKKKAITAILVELEKILHNAVNMEIEKALTPYDMILITVKTLQDRSKQRTASSPPPAPKHEGGGKVLLFKRKE